MEFDGMTKRAGIRIAAGIFAAMAAGPLPLHAQTAVSGFDVAGNSEGPILFNNRAAGTRQQASQSLRMGQLEDQIRRLNGQVEELTYQMRQLQDQIRRMQEDNEFRFQELENRGSRRKRSQVPAAPENAAAEVPQGQILGTLPADPTAPQNDDPIARAIGTPLDLSTLANDGANLTASAPLAPGADAVQPVRTPQSDPREEYDLAYGYVLRGDYDLAETSFRNFIDLHPDHRLVANARYWLGESLYARKRYREAADVFLTTYTDFPTNDKAPDSLLKLGQSLYGMGERGAACATYSELITKYPGTSSALRRRTSKEMQRAQC